MNDTRVIQSWADNGAWQAQYRDESMNLWFDIGDAKETKAEAEANEADYREQQKREGSTEEPITDPAGYLSCGCHRSQPDHTCKN